MDMNQPWIYMCSPSRSPLPPPSPSRPSGSSQCTRPEHFSHASNLGWCNSHFLIARFLLCPNPQLKGSLSVTGKGNPSSLSDTLYLQKLCVSQWFSGKDSACNPGNIGSIPGEENGNPLQYSCLENPIDSKPGWL